MDITANSDRTPHWLYIRLFHQYLSCLQTNEGPGRGEENMRNIRGGPLSTIQKRPAHLVAQFFYVCLCKLLALDELLNPSVDFAFHDESCVQNIRLKNLSPKVQAREPCSSGKVTLSVTVTRPLHLSRSQ
jgi:hypothetical protein